MFAHSFDHLTGAFMESFQAAVSPEEPGVFLLPAFCTWEQPPAVEPGFTPYFVQGQWVPRPNTREEAVLAIVESTFTPAEKQLRTLDLIRVLQDEVALAHGFRNITEATFHKDDPDDTIKALANTFLQWRSDLFKAGVALQAAGTYPSTREELLTHIPTFSYSTGAK